MSKSKFNFEVIQKGRRVQPARDAAIWAERESLAMLAEVAVFGLVDALVRLEIGIKTAMFTTITDFAAKQKLGGKDDKKAVETMVEIANLAFKEGRDGARKKMRKEAEAAYCKIQKIAEESAQA